LGKKATGLYCLLSQADGFYKKGLLIEDTLTIGCVEVTQRPAPYVKIKKKGQVNHPGKFGLRKSRKD
jgi:hypothetical protein